MSRNVSVKGGLKDFQAFTNMADARKKRIRSSAAEPVRTDPLNALARKLHPEKLFLKISSVKNETKSIKTFRVIPDTGSGTSELPVFRAGQYLSFKVDVGGTSVTRPYSISSSPVEALKDGYMEFSIRRKDGGFVTQHIWENWTEGAKLEASAPAGFFYHDPIRDSKKIIGLAGGCGFTPFRSMVRDMLDRETDMEIVLLFGIRTPDEILLGDEFRAMEKKSAGSFKMVYVCSEPDSSWKGPKGFLTEECIREHAGEVSGATFFICGPPAMYRFLETEMKKFDIPARRIRREVFGEVEDVTMFDDFPKEAVGREFEIAVQVGEEWRSIPAVGTESVLVALERAKIEPLSQCRSGECGFCDSVLISGNVFVSPENDGRRKAGIKFGHFHPCSAYPVSNLRVKVARST